MLAVSEATVTCAGACEDNDLGLSLLLTVPSAVVAQPSLLD